MRPHADIFAEYNAPYVGSSIYIYIYVVVTNILCNSHAHHVLYTLRKSSETQRDKTETKIEITIRCTTETQRVLAFYDQALYEA